MYVGWGHKYSVDNMNPELPALPQEEFVSGPEITEDNDPSPQEEATFKKMQDDAAEDADIDHEEEGGEGEEEEEDD